MNTRLVAIEETAMSVRSYHRLKAAEIANLGQLASWTEEDLLLTRIIGRKSVIELRAVLAEYGLHFGMGGEGEEDKLGVREPRPPSLPSRSRAL